MEMRIQRVVLETRHQRITGDLHMPREGYRSRLSDYLNRGDDHFVPLSNAEIAPLDGPNGHVQERDFLAVARTHVTLAYPYAENGKAS
jgi:hypothetical protein